MRRALIGFIGVMSLTIAAAGGVSLYSRWGGPDFVRGGVFGAPAPAASARAHTAAARSVRATKKDTARARTSTARNSAARTGGALSARSSFTPAEGSYTYDASGHEQVHLGSTSPCSWDLKTSTLDVKRDGGSYVLDWTYSQERQERLIVDYRSRGIYTEFAGAAVTCFGFRKTDQGDYSPHPLRMPLAPRVGATWTSTAHTQDRTEKITGTIVSRHPLSVPVGRFDVFEYDVHVDISGGQNGTVELTGWFAPALGLDVQMHTVTDATSGSARFQSDTTLRLRRRP